MIGCIACSMHAIARNVVTWVKSADAETCTAAIFTVNWIKKGVHLIRHVFEMKKIEK